MISQNDLAHILVAHHGAVPEGADLAAKLILDHTSTTGTMPLAVLIERSKAAYPLFFAKPSATPTAPEPTPEPGPLLQPAQAVDVAPAVAVLEPAAAPVEPPRPMSLTERVALAAKMGEALPDVDMRAALAGMKARGV